MLEMSVPVDKSPFNVPTYLYLPNQNVQFLRDDHVEIYHTMFKRQCLIQKNSQ